MVDPLYSLCTGIKWNTLVKKPNFFEEGRKSHKIVISGPLNDAPVNLSKLLSFDQNFLHNP